MTRPKPFSVNSIENLRARDLMASTVRRPSCVDCAIGRN